MDRILRKGGFLWIFCVVASVSMLSSSARGAAIVYDPINWLENVYSYIEQGMQYETQAENTVASLRRLENQVRSMKQLPDSLKGQYSSLADIRAHLSSWETYTNNLKYTIGTSRSVANMIKGEARFASAKGVSFKDAVSHMVADAKGGNSQAKATLKADAKTIANSNKSLKRLQASAEQLQSTNPSRNQMLQTLTLQLNHLLAMQTKIYDAITVSDAKKARKTLEKTTQEQQSANMATALDAAQTHIDASDEAQMKALQSKYPSLTGTTPAPASSSGG